MVAEGDDCCETILAHDLDEGAAAEAVEAAAEGGGTVGSADVVVEEFGFKEIGLELLTLACAEPAELEQFEPVAFPPPLVAVLAAGALICQSLPLVPEVSHPFCMELAQVCWWLVPLPKPCVLPLLVSDEEAVPGLAAAAAVALENRLFVDEDDEEDEIAAVDAEAADELPPPMMGVDEKRFHVSLFIRSF